MNYQKIVEELLKKGSNNIRKNTIILNNDKPIFEKEDFNVIEGKPKYFGIDKYGRVKGGIALISKNTIPLITDKELEYPRPYGWNKNLELKEIEPKYIQGTRTTEKAILDSELKICNKCKNKTK